MMDEKIPLLLHNSLRRWHCSGRRRKQRRSLDVLRLGRHRRRRPATDAAAPRPREDRPPPQLLAAEAGEHAPQQQRHHHTQRHRRPQLRVEVLRDHLQRHEAQHEGHGRLQVGQLRHGAGDDQEERAQGGDGEQVGGVDHERAVRDAQAGRDAVDGEHHIAQLDAYQAQEERRGCQPAADAAVAARGLRLQINEPWVSGGCRRDRCRRR
mmetsp:Transcript_21603/g.34601  ORF Transcript_21603/g.34601 Transcript_21603/m.34601 type:complete len:209 (+) Transcript_21603:3-629(+)